MAHPLDLRTVLLAKHSQHVVLIHFPIALFVTGVAFDLLSGGKPDSRWAGAAYLNLTAAALSVIPAIITGLLAWHFALEGKHLKGLLLLHVLSAIGAALFLVVSWWIHWRSRQSEPLMLPAYRIPIEMIGVVVIGLTSHLGGFLSGVNL